MKTSLRTASSSIALALLLAACGNKGPLVKPSQVMPPEPLATPAFILPADAATDAPAATEQAAQEEGAPAPEVMPEATPSAPEAAPDTTPPVDDGSGG